MCRHTFENVLLNSYTKFTTFSLVIYLLSKKIRWRTATKHNLMNIND